MWEYKLVDWPTNSYGDQEIAVAEAQINQLGAAGWELVGVVTRVGGQAT
jgi:uncharacterized protein DUF4177